MKRHSNHVLASWRNEKPPVGVKCYKPNKNCPKEIIEQQKRIENNRRFREEIANGE